MGEFCDGVVELATPVCLTAGAATEHLAALRDQVRACERAALLGAGVHPAAPFGAVRHRTGPYYDAVSAATRGLLRQTTFCGVHVHVGMPDPETAIATYNGMRRWVPLLQALSANSPYWHGQDSGLASARSVVCHSVPRTVLPRAFRDWADYSACVAELCRVGELRDAAAIWWDVRPHPRLGTVEIRCLDAQSSLADLRGLAALVHCLAVHEAGREQREHSSVEVLAEATFRAVRDAVGRRAAALGPRARARGARHRRRPCGCADVRGRPRRGRAAARRRQRRGQAAPRVRRRRHAGGDRAPPARDGPRARAAGCLGRGVSSASACGH